MGDLGRAAKRGWNSVRKFVRQTGDSMEEGSKRIGETLGFSKAGLSPKSDRTKKMMAPPVETIIPMADEEELRRSRRRRAASQPRAGRASTILSAEDDTLG